jgi:hypothetical protein
MITDGSEHQDKVNLVVKIFRELANLNPGYFYHIEERRVEEEKGEGEDGEESHSEKSDSIVGLRISFNGAYLGCNEYENETVFVPIPAKEIALGQISINSAIKNAIKEHKIAIIRENAEAEAEEARKRLAQQAAHEAALQQQRAEELAQREAEIEAEVQRRMQQWHG